MGQRAASHRFMPNMFVFPGGKVDPGDARLRPPSELHPAVMRRLTRSCTPARARALAMAAIRETWEETGLVLGEPETPTLKSRSPQWREFLRFDVNPRLDSLHLVARAITPPYHAHRFDARFFMGEAELIQGEPHEAPQGSGELLRLHWVSLRDARSLALPEVTRIVLAEVERRLRDGQQPEDPGPFVYYRRGRHVIAKV
jgi:8-oxo-dGTP pyrophosphatase MutT (NUDIX family)